MKKNIFSLLVLLAGVQLTLNAQTTNHQVYAVFVVSIAKYSSWPESDGKDFKIMVLGKSKVYDELTKATASKDIHGKKIQVTQSEDIQGATDVDRKSVV